MKRILVTGANGYIGSTLVPLLISKQYEVVSLDTNFFTETLGPELNVNKKFINKDVRNINESDVENIDAVIHLAALSNDPMGSIDPGLTNEINYKASIKIARLAKKAGAKRFLFSSSCSIYGIGKEETVSEESSVNPLTAYAQSKIDTENDLIKLADSNFCVGLMRNSTVYGYSPRFRDDLVVNNFTAHAVATKKIKILSDGTPWRPLIDVRDLSLIFSEFLVADENKVNGNIINVGFAENNLQVKSVLSVVKKCVKGCEVEYTGEHGADTRSYKVSFKKFEKLFPQIKQEWSLEKSVQDLVKRLEDAKFSNTQLQSHEYTRLAVLQKLIENRKLDGSLYWV